MAESREWCNWHLTPSGWVRGSDRVDGQGVEVREPPNTTVLSCRFYEILHDSQGRWHRELKTIWMSSNAETVASLLAKFGGCPQEV